MAIINSPLYTKSGLKISNNYIRIVSSKKAGGYYEILPSDMIKENIKKIDVFHIDYNEYRTIKDDVKIYHQVNMVWYADYIPNMFYVSIKKAFKTKQNKLVSYID